MELRNSWMRYNRITILGYICTFAFGFLMVLQLYTFDSAGQFDYEQMAFAQEDSDVSQGEKKIDYDVIVTIPFGAYNPNLDTPAEEWYSPTNIQVEVGHTVLWNNTDAEAHTVTSGEGAGRLGWTAGEFGNADGRFDSGRFMPDETWSYTFKKSGAYPYFCKIHPWMEGTIIVGPKIPEYPVDGAGNKIKSFPVIEYTKQREYEVDITWEPNVIKTGKKITFAIGVYDPISNRNLPRIPFEFVLEQNAREILRLDSETQIAGTFVNHVFEQSGPVKIKIEKIDGMEGLSTEYSTIVFENPEDIKPEEVRQIQPARNIRLSQTVLSTLILAPTAVFVFILVWYMKGKSFTRRKKQDTA